jgi:hypothetical protein
LPFTKRGEDIMFISKDGKDWFDILGGESVPSANPEIAEQARALRGALLARLEKQYLPPLHFTETQSPRSSPLTNLSQWLQNSFERDWLPPMTVRNFAPARSLKQIPHVSTDSDVERAQLIELESETVVLVVRVMLQKNETVKISLIVEPIKGIRYLPVGLKIMILDELEQTVDDLKDETGNMDDSVTLELTGEIGEQFSVNFTLGKVSIIRNFEI